MFTVQMGDYSSKPVLPSRKEEGEKEETDSVPAPGTVCSHWRMHQDFQTGGLSSWLIFLD